MKNKKSGSIKKNLPFSMGEIVPLFIDSVATGGAGVGRYEGFVVFTPFTCPGDNALVRIVRIKKNFAQAELVSIKKPADTRISPKCVVFQKCGGCTWQHISYKEQLLQKQQILESALKKKIPLPLEVIKNIVPSPKQWNYRNRVQLKVDQKGNYGFYEKKSQSLVKIKDCPIADTALFREIDKFILSLTGKALLNSKASATRKKQQHQKVEVYLSEDNKVQYQVDSVQLQKSKNTFAQVNQGVNQILICNVLKHLKTHIMPNQTVYDLYCGHGNFTFPISKTLQPKEIIGVELSLSAIQRAKKEALDNKHDRVKFIAQDVQQFLQECTKLNGPVLLDPPRIGCDQGVLHSLRELKPSVIFYISCNPQTLARDLEIINGTDALYKTILVQAYDMFPQTDHVESLVILKLQN
ncbi:MAG: class I SAM-dependent RNA methyltransferase [Bdellovibrionaceae bacterium]|nr:class I SAM-dependent RNA methyltransferase [Pseudobdellovibrionaceae bacterium]